MLVHGYMGSSYDMKTVRDVLMLYKPQLLVLLSESNEKRTEGSIFDMGKRLAEEVTSYISSIPSNLTMYSYISLGSPHLGCSQFSNKIVEAGLWLISKIKNSVCIQQLTLKDSLNFRQCYLYELARNSKLSCFEQVLLVSSSQDSYVPFESARIEVDIDNPNTIQLEMADGIIENIRQLHRINVDFPIKDSLIGNLHGRAAHISLLDSQSFLNILVYRFADIFNTR